MPASAACAEAKPNGSFISGSTRLRSNAAANAMLMRSATMPQNDEPVRCVTAHSMGRAWHSNIMSEMIVASRSVRASDVSTPMPAYVVSDAAMMKAMAE